MAYTGLTIETTVHDPTMSSHTIPAYPEYYSDTTFDAAFYAERRAECDNLVGASIDYIEDTTNPGTPGNPGGAVDITDAAIVGPATISIGGDYVFHVEGTNDSDYTNDYTVTWSVPAGQGTIWEYTSDVTDVLYVTASGISAGSGTVTCTLTERGNPTNFKTVTKAITIS